MIEIDNLDVRLPGFSLKTISLRIASGEFFTIIGPTGAGKTLILESIAGLVPVAAGRIRISGRDVTHLPPERRGIGIVYQDQTLFPHLSVDQNIRYGLRYRSKTAGGEQKLAYLVKRLGLERLLDRTIANLSGGERQRVALARALAVTPQVLLLDEPLSALDPNFREEIRDLLKALHRETGITVLMVSHDFAETHFLADRSAVISAGRIEQIGSVADIFNRPSSPAIAAFVGMHNIFEVSFEGCIARTGTLSLTLPAVTDPSHRFMAIRPEDVQVHGGLIKMPESAVNLFCGCVARIDHQGVFCAIQAHCNNLVWQAILPTGRLMEENIVEGSEVRLQVKPEKIHVM